ncbi:MAG: MBL fold metallo-hydrolase [Candidatus Bathyarchaeia archaeon]
MKVLENVHYVECPLMEDFTGISIVLGDTVAVVDAGLEGSFRDVVFPYLRGLGRRPDEVELAVITHEHGDHFEGLPELRRVSRVKVAAHEAGAKSIEPGVDMLLRDGDRLKAGGLELEVIHTPGHSPGSICLYEPRLRLLFTGDSVQGNGTVIQGIALYGDRDVYLNSMKRLGQLPVETLVAAHRYRPASGAVLRGEEARAFISESIRQVERYEAELRRLIAGKTQLPTAEELNRQMCALFTPGSTRPEYGAWTIAGYLERYKAGEWK